MPNKSNTPAFTHADAVEAATARITGTFDNSKLGAFGPLSTSVTDDVLAIFQCVKRETPTERSSDLERVTAGLSAEKLSAMPDGALADAYQVCVAMKKSAIFEGFDEDDEVDGADAVEAVGELWPTITRVAS